MELGVVFTQAQLLVMGAAMQIVGIFTSIMTRFNALNFLLTLIFILILNVRLFGRYSSAGSDGVRRISPNNQKKIGSGK